MEDIGFVAVSCGSEAVLGTDLAYNLEDFAGIELADIELVVGIELADIELAVGTGLVVEGLEKLVVALSSFCLKPPRSYPSFASKSKRIR